MDAKEFQKNEITKYIKYFKENKLDLEDYEFIEELENSIAKIMKIQIDEIGMNLRFEPENYEDKQKNDIYLGFIKKEDDNNNSNLGSFYPNHKNMKPKITINLCNYKDIYLNDDDPNKRVWGCLRMFRTLFHELGHYKQYLMVKQCVSSKDALSYGRDFVLLPYRRALYDRNYDSFAIETNANLEAFKEYDKIMGEDEFSMRSKYLYKGEFETGRYKYYKADKNGRKRSHKKMRDDVSRKIIDQILSNENKDYIFEISPILLKEYNYEDCSRKTPVQLIEEMEGEKALFERSDFIEEDEKQKLLTDSKEMYFELIYIALKDAKKEQLIEIIDKYGKKYFEELLDDLKQYFDNEMNRKIREAERMEFVQSRPGEFPNTYFTEKNPLKVLLKKNAKITKYYRKKYHFLEKIEDFVKEYNVMDFENKNHNNKSKSKEFADDLKVDTNIFTEPKVANIVEKVQNDDIER